VAPAQEPEERDRASGARSRDGWTEGALARVNESDKSVSDALGEAAAGRPSRNTWCRKTSSGTS